MLGRGLESLIPNKNQVHPGESSNSSPHKASAAEEDAIFHIEIEKIKPNPHQPRKVFNEEALEELASSVREMGIIQPLIVSKVTRETDTGTEVEYQLIAGERRLMAAKKIGLERVPAIVRSVAQEKDKLEMAIVENVQRADLNPMEAARSYAKLQEGFGLTQREVAARVGKSRETIANSLRLLNLPSFVQEAISREQISDSQGRLLLAVSDASQQKSLFEEIIRNNLSVRELRSRISGMKRLPGESPLGAKPAPIKSPELSIMEEKLQELFGTKVSLQKTAEGGKIMISFFSPEEFQSLINKLMPLFRESDDSQLI